jgi:hypothetical protein
MCADLKQGMDGLYIESVHKLGFLNLGKPSPPVNNSHQLNF